MVSVHVFDQNGQLIGPVQSPKVVLSNEEWQKRLTPAQYQVLRQQGTERAFCGNLLDNKKQGVYSCAGCGLPLFSSQAKFNSGTGWPSFFQPISPGNVLEHSDVSYGMIRIEIVCARCDGHLGHVFPDGPPPSGRRYCLNSESLKFTQSDDLTSLADPVVFHSSESSAQKAELPAPDVATAIFAGGCFWCTEVAFEQLKGVSDVESGYIGGSKASANYEMVCTGKTGHAEAIRITYNPQIITFEQLLTVFFDAHDPTQLNRQGADIGTQYRSAIFVANEAEKQQVQRKIAALNKYGTFTSPIVTTIEPLTEFFPAEPYHQDYARHNPDQPYIQMQALPKACKIREKHGKWIQS